MYPNEEIQEEKRRFCWFFFLILASWKTGVCLCVVFVVALSRCWPQCSLLCGSGGTERPKFDVEVVNHEAIGP